jgi:pimeloyl-ACP methyl ester carboxylesterase
MSLIAPIGHVILSHGMESGPNATKVTRLAAVAETLGFSAERVDDQGIVDALRRLDRLLPKIDQAPRPLFLVGSSLGAYVSGLASLQREVEGLFLLAPPVRLPGIQPDLALRARHIAIVHGWRDELIGPDEVYALARATHAELKLYDADHRLTDVVDDIERDFAAFLRRCMPDAAAKRVSA